MDQRFCEQTKMFVCPLCSKEELRNFVNFCFHYRYGSENNFDIIETTWNTIDDEMKSLIADHIYPDFPVFSTKPNALGPLHVYSNRGIANNYHICYLNVVFQILCGLPIYKLIAPLSSVAEKNVLDALHGISEKLNEPYGTTFQFDKVMRQVAHIVSGKDVKNVDRQGVAGNDFDATEAMRRIIDHILHSYPNMDATFEVRTVHVRKCRKCCHISGNVANNFMLYIPVAETNYVNCSVQSLLWDWCTISNHAHTHNACMCEDNEPDYLERSFVPSAPAMLTVVLNRVKDNRSIDNREVSIPSTLELGHILAGKTALQEASYSLAALIHLHGDNYERNGHYSCALMGEKNSATIFNDSHVENVCKDTHT